MVAFEEQGSVAAFVPSTIPCRYADRCSGTCRQLKSDLLDPATYAEMDCVRRFRRRSLVGAILLTLVIAAAGFCLAYLQAERSGIDTLRTKAEAQLTRFTGRLEREIDKFGILPLTASMNRDVIDFLQASQKPGAADAMNRYLANLNRSAGTAHVYLIDPAGVIVASSNWNQPPSFLGRNISYRPYFQQAKAGTVSGYYAIGTTGNASGYYLATAVEQDGRRLGVIAVKIGLEQLERDWLDDVEQPVIVSDVNNVVILSSRPDWKYHTLGPIDPVLAAQVLENQQYNRHSLETLAWAPTNRLADGSFYVRMSDTKGSRTYLAVSGELPRDSMHIVVLTDRSEIWRLAMAQGIIAAIVIILASLSLHIFNQRRMAIRERLRAREALQEAYKRLEHQFDMRSAELRTANAGLRHEVAERIQTVRRLQAFQEELIRTENLAVIGQLSAGLAHEINQPLAALSTLSENAVRFLELNDHATVRFNLERICDLVRRMGVLTGQLRSFARRSDGEKTAVDLGRSIDSAVALLGHRLKTEHVRITLSVPDEGIQGFGEAVRLEQVLVNLISNAMDAVAGNGEAEIRIRAGWQDSRPVIEVADNGPGLSSAVVDRLFEPFFTTKKTNGLGLGLAISQDIVRNFGGDLVASNGSNGGAVFKIILKGADAPEVEHA